MHPDAPFPDRRTYCPGPCGQVHVRIVGDGQPLLLSHQSPASLRQFEAVYARLAAAGIQAIGIDTPGFGQSDAPPAPPRIEDYADSVIAVLDALGIDVADILGQHTGSMIAMAATIRAPHRFRRLVLNSPTPFTAAERQQWLDAVVARQRGAQLCADGSHFTAAWERRVRMTPGWTHLGAMQRAVVDLMRAGSTAWYGMHAALHYDQLAELARITHRTLLLTNTGDALYPLCRSTRDRRPDFDYAELAGGTHDIVDEQPEAWVAAVTRFLAAP